MHDMNNDSENTAKVWQVQAIEKRQDSQDKVLERLDLRISDYTKNQVTYTQFEERLKSIQSSYEDKLKAKQQSHDADIREVNLKYGPLAENYKWITRGVIMLILAQVVALVFNLLGTRS
jgi:hypothetical protein